MVVMANGAGQAAATAGPPGLLRPNTAPNPGANPANPTNKPPAGQTPVSQYPPWIQQILGMKQFQGNPNDPAAAAFLQNWGNEENATQYNSPLGAQNPATGESNFPSMAAGMSQTMADLQGTESPIVNALAQGQFGTAAQDIQTTGWDPNGNDTAFLEKIYGTPASGGSGAPNAALAGITGPYDAQAAAGVAQGQSQIQSLGNQLALSQGMTQLQQGAAQQEAGWQQQALGLQQQGLTQSEKYLGQQEQSAAAQQGLTQTGEALQGQQLGLGYAEQQSSDWLSQLGLTSSEQLLGGQSGIAAQQFELAGQQYGLSQQQAETQAQESTQQAQYGLTASGAGNTVGGKRTLGNIQTNLEQQLAGQALGYKGTELGYQGTLLGEQYQGQQQALQQAGLTQQEGQQAKQYGLSAQQLNTQVGQEQAGYQAQQQGFQNTQKGYDILSQQYGLNKTEISGRLTTTLAQLGLSQDLTADQITQAMAEANAGLATPLVGVVQTVLQAAGLSVPYGSALTGAGTGG